MRANCVCGLAGRVEYLKDALETSQGQVLILSAKLAEMEDELNQLRFQVSKQVRDVTLEDYLQEA